MPNSCKIRPASTPQPPCGTAGAAGPVGGRESAGSGSDARELSSLIRETSADPANDSLGQDDIKCNVLNDWLFLKRYRKCIYHISYIAEIS